MNRTSRHPTKILVSSNDYEAPHPHAVNLVSSVTIINVNIFSSSNITLHNLQHHMFFSSPDFPANITPQTPSDLMLSTKVEHKLIWTQVFALFYTTLYGLSSKLTTRLT